MNSSSHPSPGSLAVLAALGCLASCSDTAGGSNEILLPTMVQVSPSEFLGPIPCGNGPDAARQYVATFIDTPIEGEPIRLPSTGPVPCSQPVGTTLALPGRTYSAQVDIYDREGLWPLAPGSPTMTDIATGDYVPPRWRTDCLGPIAAVTNRIRTVHACSATELGAADASATVTVLADVGVAGLRCGEEAGAVARIEAAPADGSGVREAGCGQGVVFEGLAPGESYSFNLSAYEAGATVARWGASCHATPMAGGSELAVCDPLRGGSIDVELKQLLAEVHLGCAQVQAVSVGSAGGGAALERRDLGCANILRISDVPTGEYELAIDADLKDGSKRQLALCSANVVVPAAAAASCRAPQ